MASLAVGAVATAGAIAYTARQRRSSSFNHDDASSTSRTNGGTSKMNGVNNHDDKNVGILAMETYFPFTYVSQERLEEHSGVPAGKYRIGLGQDKLAVVTGDAEDINSLCLTVVHSLLDKYGIDPSRVGRLEVGTETLVDKSKSAKTVLMSLFGDNTDVEGATVVNACYGGTAALLNAFHWCESSGWDGRYALVVAADIATYARGPARPTSGAGAVAVLVGRDAPLAFRPKERATHAAHVWDFFKPDPSVEYPTVDGALSQVCYYRALEDVYERFLAKLPGSPEQVTVETAADYYCFHAPYNKLVQKSFARLFLMDARRRHSSNGKASEDHNEAVEEKKLDHPLQEWVGKKITDTYNDKQLEKAVQKLSATSFQQKCGDANYASTQVGNTYTASVFFGLASLVDRLGADKLVDGTTIGMFSYGSGALATMYRLHVRNPTTDSPFTVQRMAATLQLTKRLEQRIEIHPSELDYALETRARMHRAGAPYSPVYPTALMFPGTYYLHGVDSQWRREYGRVPIDATPLAVSTPEKDDFVALAPPLVLRLAQRDAVSQPVTGKLQVLLASKSEDEDEIVPALCHLEAQRRIACVVTGTAAGLPGQSNGPDNSRVFGPDNLDRLIAGHSCIAPISGSVKASLLEKNVVQLVKNKKDGSTARKPIDSDENVIQLAAQLSSLDLTSSYGVPPGLAQTMDVAAQVAVAAGMEALKNAGLVSGRSNDPSEWKLDHRYRDTTGVVYASSFPAMDAAVGEVMRFLQSKTVGAADSVRLVSALRSRLVRASPDRELSDGDEAAFARLLARANEVEPEPKVREDKYEFDRKFLFRVLVLGNAQLAQLAGIRGPNTQTNAACAGTTQAIAMAQDMLISGRAQRVVVVAGDNAAGETLLPWLGCGFSALGATTTLSSVEEAACPFDKRRSGLLLGAGGIGMVLETEASVVERQMSSPHPFRVKARLLQTQYSNSAFHGAALDREHIGDELARFLGDVELLHGISKAEIAQHGVYYSHETSTHATSASSCAGNEIAALRRAFGDDLVAKLLIVNTKGFTGHPMGVSFEDVAAVESLLRQAVPPVANYKVPDEYLGELKISPGGKYACRYALRFAAGFGSQVAFALYATAEFE